MHPFIRFIKSLQEKLENKCSMVKLSFTCALCNLEQNRNLYRNLQTDILAQNRYIFIFSMQYPGWIYGPQTHDSKYTHNQPDS